MEQDLWDGNFHSIFLHGILGYLSLNSKHIKELLRHITKYIKNKSIKSGKANNIPDLKNIGEAVWNFIFMIYESGWDSLITNKDNCSF